MRKKIPLIGGIINLIESLKGDIGIIENTDVATHSIPSGSYVIWKNELYTASSAISVGDALSSSNLTAVSGGAANKLNNKLTIISGTVRMNTGTATNVNFGMTFAEAPIVVLSDSSDYPGAAAINHFKVTSTTTTGFTLRAERPDSGTFGTDPVWKAIGYT